MGRRRGPCIWPSTQAGLKLFGEGEWSEAGKKTGWGPVFPQNAPAWQGQTEGLGATLHLAVDTETGEILAHTLTGSDHHDGPELPGLLAKVKAPVAVVSADKGYDSIARHRAILAIEARPSYRREPGLSSPRHHPAIHGKGRAKDPGRRRPTHRRDRGQGVEARNGLPPTIARRNRDGPL